MKVSQRQARAWAQDRYDRIMEPDPRVSTKRSRGLRSHGAPCWVYVVTDGILIKIGSTVNVRKRLQQLNDARPALPVELVLAFEGTRGDEAGMLNRYSRHLIRCEWFAPHPQLISELVEMLHEDRYRIETQLALDIPVEIC